ncbi:unnamed protein product [Menidia menidia]|uniref:(Atlantic silverside) hypothetical protein n=1 Tax=Menidia menidia TaxID=238744 RepID=A0A8S4AKX4_9TELE|nr:unnamed protein product [Menidia menidia]
MHPVSLWVAAAVVGVLRGAASECWEHPSCQDLNSKSRLMECIQLCGSDSSIIPNDIHPRHPPSSDPLSASPYSSVSSSPEARRSYSMEHFRWGKPVGRKRRPIKIYTTNSVEESAELFPGGVVRRELSREMSRAKDEDDNEAREEMETRLGHVQEKTNGTYKMKHFRWGGPAEGKRYGGFMKSSSERSQRPLLTLFKNVISKVAPVEK